MSASCFARCLLCVPPVIVGASCVCFLFWQVPPLCASCFARCLLCVLRVLAGTSSVCLLFCTVPLLCASCFARCLLCVLLALYRRLQDLSALSRHLRGLGPGGWWPLGGVSTPSAWGGAGGAPRGPWATRGFHTRHCTDVCTPCLHCTDFLIFQVPPVCASCFVRCLLCVLPIFVGVPVEPTWTVSWIFNNEPTGCGGQSICVLVCMTIP